MNWITEHWDEILQALGAVYVAATLIAALTPTDKDDTVLDKIGKWADRLGFKIKGE